VEIVYFCLVAFGMTQIIVYGSIFDNVRPCGGWFGKLFRCTMCTGFWVGVFLWIINGWTSLFNFEYSIVTGFLLGCLASGVSYMLSTLFDDEGLQVKCSLKKGDNHGETW
jgi:hypothetical protein